MRSWRRKAAAIGAVAGTAMIGVPLALSGTAFAAQATSPQVTVKAGAGNVGQGQGSSQPATLTFTLTGGFTSGSKLAIDIGTAITGTVATNSATAGPSAAVTFAARPTVTVTPTSTATTTAAPKITASLSANPNDPGTAGPAGAPGNDQLNLTLGTTDSTTADSYNVTVSGVTIAAGPTTPTGPIDATSQYYSVSQNAVLSGVALSGTLATVTNYTETILTPIGVQRDGTTALPAVTFTESAAGGTFKSGAYTYTLPVGDTFSGTPSVTATGGTVASSPAPTIAGGVLTFTYTQSSTTPASITISGLSANATSTVGTPETATLANTTTAFTPPNPTEKYGVVTLINPAIAGVSAADTAVQVFNNATGSSTAPTSSIVLATDVDPEDALSASYLVNYLNGGTPGKSGLLLTDQNSLPPAVQQAMINHCVQTVYILGGPLAVSAAVQQQVQAIKDACTGIGTIQTIRYAGQTQYDTNQAVLSAFPPAAVKLSLPYASGSTYDPVGGGESPATTPSTAAPTAIVASGNYNAYQDALSAGVVSAATGAPVILTSTASLSSTAANLLSTGGYKQVILMGGPDATSPAVATSIQNLGLNVFRAAGQDATQTSELFATLAQTAGFSSAVTFSSTGGVYLARGNGFQDALSFAQLGAKVKSPILLTENPSTLGQYLTGYLNMVGATPTQDTVNPIGGNLALTPTVLQAAVNALAAG